MEGTMQLGLSSNIPLPPAAKLTRAAIPNNNHKLHFRLGHDHASFRSFSRARKHRCRFGLRARVIVCAKGKWSMPWRDEKKQSKCRDGNEGKLEVVRSFVLACALGVGIIGVSLMRRDRVAMAGPRELYQKAPQSSPVGGAGYSLGGRTALRSLLDVPKLMASSKVEPFQVEFELPYSPSTAEVIPIKMHAVKLMAHGQSEAAVKFLRDAVYLYKNRKDNEPAYNVGMVLVEILICQGKYKEALECNSLNEHQRLPSDGRFPLYKAIIYTMLDNKVEAKKWWEQYIEAVEQGIELPQDPDIA
ncbi:unnamed protein product [Linum trigynum]|uniref:Uncharacterized protein n=1 Tax=Linum trigynum TaxID=586398 RepID=A0AAV2FXK3_9ROSI